MGFRTEYLKKLPYSPQKSGVDGFLQIHFQRMNPDLKIVRINTLNYDSLDTNGYNNISKRNSFFDNPTAPFEKTKKTLNDLDLPQLIKDKLCQLDV